MNTVELLDFDFTDEYTDTGKDNFVDQDQLYNANRPDERATMHQVETNKSSNI